MHRCIPFVVSKYLLIQSPNVDVDMSECFHKKRGFFVPVSNTRSDTIEY